MLLRCGCVKANSTCWVTINIMSDCSADCSATDVSCAVSPESQKRGGVQHITPPNSVKPRSCGNWRNLAEFCGISRDLAELGGISRDLAEFRGIWRNFARFGGNWNWRDFAGLGEIEQNFFSNFWPRPCGRSGAVPPDPAGFFLQIYEPCMVTVA